MDAADPITNARLAMLFADTPPDRVRDGLGRIADMLLLLTSVERDLDRLPVTRREAGP